jgi:hypothetical protein
LARSLTYPLRSERVGLCLMAPRRRFALSGIVRALLEGCRELEALSKSFICCSWQQAGHLPVFTNGFVSDSNQNHFIPFAHLIRV